VEVVRAGGAAYLELVTRLLRRGRLASPLEGLWEAADLQWWYTRDPHEDADNAVFWLDGGEPVAAVVVTRWTQTRYGCDVLGTLDQAWEAARDAGPPGVRVEMAVAPRDVPRAIAAGFTQPAEEYWVCWLDAADRALPRELPPGYTITARPDQRGPHPMIGRNGAAVEERLRQCSLYDPECDLAVLAPDGSVVGYALFWPDPVTGVGLVEPMRVEEAHAGRGLAGTLLREGLDRLVARGCGRLKVSFEDGNHAAERLYRGAGFVPYQKEPTYFRGGDGSAL
jgi:predicted N-acetyltransferase YhbS